MGSGRVRTLSLCMMIGQIRLLGIFAAGTNSSRLTDYMYYFKQEASTYTILHNFAAVYILLGAGGLMTLIGLLGCVGAIQESQCLLSLFFACLLFIFGAEIAAGVFGFINKEKIVEEIQKFYSSSISDTSNSNNTAIAFIYHKTLNCCGSSSSEVSTTICADVAQATPDCHSAITEFFNEKLHIIGYIGISVAGVMIIEMVFSMVLCCAIRNNREVI